MKERPNALPLGVEIGLVLFLLKRAAPETESEWYWYFHALLTLNSWEVQKSQPFSLWFLLLWRTSFLLSWLSQEVHLCWKQLLVPLISWHLRSLWPHASVPWWQRASGLAPDAWKSRAKASYPAHLNSLSG